MTENNPKYQTPTERLDTLIEDVATDLKENHPRLTWQKLAETWRKNKKEYKNIKE
ncbi:MAG: hypothetical protein SWY16_15120 [Cyanobacteriota bacterium]|nr:hypothetical protein [Cyanobacteriota bacterium]